MKRSERKMLNQDSGYRRWGRFGDVLAVISVFYLFSGVAVGPGRMIGKYLPEMVTSYQYTCKIFLILFMIWLIVAMTIDYKIVLSIIRQTGLIWLLIFLAFLSTLWSSWKGGTLQYSFALAGTTGLGIFISLRFRVDQQLQMLALVMIAIALSSLLLIAIYPSIGIMSGIHEGAWKGVFLHKNFLGKIMALGVLVFLFVPIHGKTNHFLSGGGAVLCAYLLLRSRSRNSLLTLGICLLMYAFLTQFHNYSRNVRQSPFTLICLLVGISAAVWFYWNIEWVFQLMTRDVTLVSRAVIWEAVIEKIKLHPWGGYGYGAFWRGSETGVSGEVAQAIGWYPDHAHNGFLDLALDLGLVGLSIFLIYFLWILLRVYKTVLKSLSQTTLDYWPAIYLLFFMCYNLLESDLFRHYSPMWILSVAVITTLLSRGKGVKHNPG